MARIVVAGAGAIGASIAYHLALQGTDDRIVLCDRAEVASGATGKAMGGVRQQFTTAPEVRLAQASARFFAGLARRSSSRSATCSSRPPRQGAAELERRAGLQRELGVPVEDVDPGSVAGLRVDDIQAAVICREDGIADPAAVTRRLVNDARKLGVELREFTDARQLDTDVLVVACGAASPELVDVPVRPLVRQLTDTRRVDGLPEDLPMVVEAESGFHFRRVDGGLRLAMGESTLRWGTDAQVDEGLVEDWLGRIAKRYPSAAGMAVARSWAGLYDMTPDAHPVIGWVKDGVYAACGFSGHGFMQAPAVGKAVAEELLDGESSFDLTPYRLERFSGDEIFPETLVL